MYPAMQGLTGLLPCYLQTPGQFQLIEHGFNRPAFAISFNDLFRAERGIGTQQEMGKGFPDAIQAVYPQAQIQLCIVHMVRNSVRYVPWKDYKPATADLKRIYQSVTEEEALLALDAFAERWDEKYPQISKSWRSCWNNLNTLFNYPEDIRRAIYTTNAIESLNSVIRKVIKKRKLFPTDDSAKKVVYLAIREASKKWSMPIRNWKMALNRFMIEFEDRLTDFV